MQKYSFSREIAGQKFIVETGSLAMQAGGAVTVQVGETVVLVTATASQSPREGADFFPLTVDFEERLYAAGRIPGSFFRREGRPSESAILLCRLVDRPIRPLFPKGYRNDVQIVITALSSDEENHLDIPAIVGASTALMISDIPFTNPVGAVRVGYIDGEFVFNPTISEMERSELDLRLAGTKDAILMVEAGAHEVPEDIVLEAMKRGHEAMQPLIELQEEMREQVGKEKREFQLFVPGPEVEEAVADFARSKIDDILAQGLGKHERNDALDALLKETIAHFEGRFDARDVSATFQSVLKKATRSRILDTGIRPDGRGPKDIRPLSSQVGLLPRTHGSGLFTRGETQVLSITTLGTPGEAQTMDSLQAEEATKRYIHHYNFPPYSTGEAYPMRGPKRREIGHGALAERALLPVIPPEDEFPYTIRVVSEVLSSNGSTSMASVCGSTLSLMDAGVPIKAPVGGIAMGLITDSENGRYRVLTDIQGMEDALGDMDFKVAGTLKGITALQMDIKTSGLNYEILKQALAQAREAREFILDHMKGTIAEPRTQLSPNAPRIITIHISPEKIGKIIGPGGKTIRGIQDQHHVKIDIDEDGSVYIASERGGDAESAIAEIEKLTEEVEVGKIYTGKVVRTTDFGAFVEILPGVDGLVHISQLADYRAPSVEDVVQVGDEVMVMVIDVDKDTGKIKLSRQAVLEGWTAEEARAKDRASRSRNRPRSGGSRSGDNRRRDNRPPRRRR